MVISWRRSTGVTWLSWVRTVGRCGLAGDADKVTYMRSSAKPIQATAAAESGALERFGITEQELAVICASHGGEPMHVEAVRSILARIGLDEDALGCGAHAPSYTPAAIALYRAGQTPTAIHNNCSGKHSGMLAAAQALGAPTATYLDPDHPVQQRILHSVAYYSGLGTRTITVAVDGCSAPVFGFPLYGMALMYARLVSPQRLLAERATAARRIVAAMQAYPEMVGGTGRFDSDVMNVGGKRLVAKGGATASTAWACRRWVWVSPLRLRAAGVTWRRRWPWRWYGVWASWTRRTSSAWRPIGRRRYAMCVAVLSAICCSASGMGSHDQTTCH